MIPLIREVKDIARTLHQAGATVQANRVSRVGITMQTYADEREPVRLRNLYAHLKAALSLQDAADILGVSPDASPDEIAKAYKKKVFENHPDRGGDPDKMVEVNVAKEILEGKRRPDLGSSPGGGSHYSQPDVDTKEEVSIYEQIEDRLNAEMTKFKKGHAWWNPPRNFAINTALSNLNCWFFTILPLFPARNAYRPADPDRGRPEGMVIHPCWQPFKNGDFPYNMKALEAVLKEAQAADTIQNRVKKDIAFVESHFNVKVPSNVEAALLKDALKVADRRWGVNRLRTKDVLVPFDGSKSIELSSWG